MFKPEWPKEWRQSGRAHMPNNLRPILCQLVSMLPETARSNFGRVRTLSGGFGLSPEMPDSARDCPPTDATTA
eukprot:5682780-Alexandrium_andersonii.AAC.1